MVDLKPLNYYNDNTFDVLRKYTKKDISLYYKTLVFNKMTTIKDAPIQSVFKSNMKYVEEGYPECTI